MLNRIYLIQNTRVVVLRHSTTNTFSIRAKTRVQILTLCYIYLHWYFKIILVKMKWRINFYVMNNIQSQTSSINRVSKRRRHAVPRRTNKEIGARVYNTYSGRGQGLCNTTSTKPWARAPTYKIAEYTRKAKTYKVLLFFFCV